MASWTAKSWSFGNSESDFTLVKRISFYIFLWLVGSQLLVAQEDREENFVHDCVERSYTVHLPPGFAPDSSYPMILFLHGFTQTGADIRAYTAFDSLADREGIIMAYPEGISGQTPWGLNRHWNALLNESVDDIGFLDRLIDRLGAQYPIDLARVYAVGFSNGGFMCYQLACALSDRIAAIASVSGSMSVDQERYCFPDRSVSILEIHGTQDRSVSPLGTRTYLSSEALIDFWRGRNDLTQFTHTEIPDIDPTDQSTVFLHQYSHPAASAELLHYEIEGGGHTWPDAAYDFPTLGATNRDLQTNEVIWDFFQQHVHPNPRSLSSVSDEPNLAPSQMIWHIDPTSRELRVQWAGGVPHWVRLYDMQGREVVSRPYPGTEWKLTSGIIPPGMYVLRYKQKGRVEQEKIVLR